jgi:hypothetical protein
VGQGCRHLFALSHTWLVLGCGRHGGGAACDMVNNERSEGISKYIICRKVGFWKTC